MNKILLEDNLQQNFVSMKDAVIETWFYTKIFHCHTGALRKKFRKESRTQNFEEIVNLFFF